MSDRYQKLTVVLDRERLEEDLEHIVKAIRMVKGVESVALGEPMHSADYMARETVLRDFAFQLIDIVRISGASSFRSDDEKAAWRDIETTLAGLKKRRGY